MNTNDEGVCLCGCTESCAVVAELRQRIRMQDAAIKRMVAEEEAECDTIRQALRDSDRLSALEAYVSEKGNLVLHNGDILGGHAGLGLANTGRTLRQAIDQMVGLDAAMRRREGGV